MVAATGSKLSTVSSIPWYSQKQKDKEAVKPKSNRTPFPRVKKKKEPQITEARIQT
jgi:hypothetical protein